MIEIAALELFINGEPEIAQLILRDLVNMAVGFEELALLTANSIKLKEIGDKPCSCWVRGVP